MDTRILSLNQARNFILFKQGLLGAKRFNGKSGIMDYIHQVGCVQFDPIDICGQNAELTLQSRINGFTKSMLAELLYTDRALIDYFDKNLSIFAIEDWPYFKRIRLFFQSDIHSQEAIALVHDTVINTIKAKGYVCSKDLVFDQKVSWYWGNTSLARVALEALYYFGELIIHHKNHTFKYYALSEHYIPKHLYEAKEPFASEIDYLKWKVLRRIKAVGLLWNRHSDAFLFIGNLKTPMRNQVFSELKRDNQIIEVSVEGIKDKLFCLAEDEYLIDQVMTMDKLLKRVEFIAPLDNVMWDRKLIKILFDFEYSWEIYTIKTKRQYGYYVLPILYGNTFVGRIELINQRQSHQLEVHNLWFEQNWQPTKLFYRAFKQALQRFAKFNNCETIVGMEKASIDIKI